MRQEQFVVGLHSVRTVLRQGASAVAELWVDAQRRDARLREILALAKTMDVPLHQVDRAELDRLANGANHQGVVARARAPAARDEHWLRQHLAGVEGPPLLLVLDGVQDPHNLGACLRSADAAGADAVLAPRDRAVGLTAVACKVASGAAQSVPYVQVTNLARTLRWLREEAGIWVVGTAGEVERSVFDTDLRAPLAVVMGGEEKGLRRLTREQCDLLVSLPMRGKVESLNVAVSAGICLYEALRQRTSGNPVIGARSGGVKEIR